jgi:hypothetical protein
MMVALTGERSAERHSALAHNRAVLARPATLSGAYAICGSGAALIDVPFRVTRSVASPAPFCDTSAVWVPRL